MAKIRPASALAATSNDRRLLRPAIPHRRAQLPGARGRVSMAGLRVSVGGTGRVVDGTEAAMILGIFAAVAMALLFLHIVIDDWPED